MVLMDQDTVMGGASHQQHVATNGFINPQQLQRRVNYDEPHYIDDSLNAPHNRRNILPVEESSEEPEPPRAPTVRRLLPTGCCYDARMKLHQSAAYEDDPHHPEDPKRIQAIYNMLVENGLLFLGTDAEYERITALSPNRYMWRVGARQATQPEICTVHTLDHYLKVVSYSEKTPQELRDLTLELDNGRTSIYIGNFTLEAALISCGGAIETCKRVVDGTVKNALAVIRPPGHHAESHCAMGFCFFNNVGVAARVCQADYPETCRKVLILDWDVHHGNGTQNMFYDDPNVLYISIHVWMNGKMYPAIPPEGGPDATETCVGEGRGIGKNVNIPWETKGMGDGEYMAAFQRIVMPIACEFAPDLVIVSAGFDAAAGDELGGCFVSPECYSQMTHMLMSLAGGKIAVCLEGGYNLDAISKSALAVAQTLMGEPPRPMDIPPINEVALKLLNKVREVHAPYWECMRPRKMDIPEALQSGAIRLNHIIRRYQYSQLRERHNFVEMAVTSDDPDMNGLFRSQVLCTPRLRSAKKLLVLVHDE